VQYTLLIREIVEDSFMAGIADHDFGVKAVGHFKQA
jgi:hypothetical protein